MTSTKMVSGLLALAALTNAAAAQRINTEERLVSLKVRVGKEHHGFVSLSGDGFVAVRPTKPPGKRFHNFQESGYGPNIDGKLMGRDPEGEDKAVRAVAKQTVDSKWKKEGGLFGMQLRAPDGPFKGWYVGLGPAEKAKGGKEVRRKLILVKDKKDAAVFNWEDLDDEGR